jgi:gamma-glutamylcyclotransferase (GGCT)/AIG2-like uncharacterized protein YtfP
MTEKPHHLFVYGTLMQAANGGRLGRAQRDRLQREATFVGAASIRGLLYDLGDYPGLCLTDDPDSIVHGEVVRLADPDHSFRWLDPYENIVAGEHPHNEYARIVAKARLEDQTELQVWVYVYNRDVGQRQPVPGGRWLVRPSQR